ncbi:gamma-glutamylcyclotransferase family protein [Roseicyclus sp.]|uniref:gamma-glutamylcyclotransferase family protein n=1 Tax=Roseicyclus sp. TaxID=1914329 RepID=UPI003F6AD75C
MTVGNDTYFFGYGSLVNRATHAYPDAAPARVAGWARVWRATTLRQVAYLSVVSRPGVEIEGLIAAVPGGDWAALDLREHAYARQPLEEVQHDAPRPREIMIYQVEDRHLAPNGAHPILLSYLDTVVQGFLREFGAAGVERFFQTTTGWEAGLLNDRAAPLYPRAQVTAARERAMVDAALQDLGVTS